MVLKAVNLFYTWNVLYYLITLITIFFLVIALHQLMPIPLLHQLNCFCNQFDYLFVAQVQFNLLVTCLVMTSLEILQTIAIKDPTATDLLPFFRCYSACNDQFVHCKVRCIMSGGNDSICTAIRDKCISNCKQMWLFQK